MDLYAKISDLIYTHVSSMCEVNGIEDATDAVIAALPDYNNYNSDWSKQQRRIVELELALKLITDRAEMSVGYNDDFFNFGWIVKQAREALKDKS
jgi:hypothetical protein